LWKKTPVEVDGRELDVPPPPAMPPPSVGTVVVTWKQKIGAMTFSQMTLRKNDIELKDMLQNVSQQNGIQQNDN
jgi:hypothetical protein